MVVNIEGVATSPTTPSDEGLMEIAKTVCMATLYTIIEKTAAMMTQTWNNVVTIQVLDTNHKFVAHTAPINNVR